jgi:hypothetical protein
VSAGWKSATAPAPKSEPVAKAAPRKSTNGSREENYLARAFDGEIEKLRGATEGDRNNQLFKSSAALIELVAGGGLVESEVHAALTETARAVGLGESEIGLTIASGFAKGRQQPRSVPELSNANRKGVYADEYTPTDADSPDAPLSVAAKRGFEVFGESEPAERPSAEEPLRGLQHLGAVALLGRARIEELAATPIDYVWRDIAVAGTIVLIAGPPAEGKTTLLFLALAARANPGEDTGEVVSLLGREIKPAPPGKWVVIIEGEHSEASTSRKLVKSLKLLGLDHAALDRVIIVARKAVRLGSPEWLDIVTLASAGLVSDIAIDTVARVAPADANDEREQVAVFDEVARAIEAAPDGAPKPLVWAVAHTRKNGGDGDLSDVSGSAQRTGQADSVLMIKGEKVDGRTVSTTVKFPKLREDPDDYPLPVTFSITESGLELEDGGADGKTDDRPLEVRISELLEKGPKTKNELKGALGRNPKDLEAAINNLFSARAITTDEVTKGGRAWKVFKLRPGAPNRAPNSGCTEPSTERAQDVTE